MPDAIKLACMSLVGRKHSDKEQPNEDACASLFQNGVSVVCLADGAGGSRYTAAAMGSSSVVRTVTELMSKHFDAFFHDVRENVARSILVTAIQSELAILANENRIDGIERMSSTMLFCAVKDSRMICGHIGDGLICKVSSSGIVPLTIPQNGENTGSTYFVTFPDAQDYLRLIKTTTDDAHAIVLMTDGLSDMVYDASTYLVRPVVAGLAELADLPETEMNEQLKETIQKFVIRPSNVSDDATIGVLYFSGTEAPETSKLLNEKQMPAADYKDVMRNVQLELLPRVKLARSYVSPDQIQPEIVEQAHIEACEEDEDALIDKSDSDNEKKAVSAPKKAGKYAFLWAILSIVAITLVVVLIIIFRP